MNKYLSNFPALLLILGAILRVITLGASALWYDEAVTLYRNGLPLMQLFNNKSEGSGDLLLELILRPLMAISPRSLWLLRLPSLLAGLVSLWLVWKLMQWFKFNQNQQLLTAALVAFLPGLLWMGQDARAYGLLACLCLAALWFALESRWLGLGACCGLMVYCHNTGPAYAAAVLVIALVLYPWKACRILVTGAGSALAWIPAILRILQDGVASIRWIPLTPERLLSAILTAIWANITTTWFFYAAFGILLLTLPLLITRLRARGHIVPLLAWAIPLAGMIVFSLVSTNVVLYRTLMPILYPFALWIGWELESLAKPVLYRGFLTGAWIGLLLAGIILWHPDDRGGRMDQVAEQIRSQWQTGDTLVYTTITTGLPFDYYLNDLPHTWLDVISAPLLMVPAIVRTVLNCEQPCQRYWIVIPDEDYLITPAEHSELTQYTHGQQPKLSITYMQAAQINIYLVEDK